jgi:hypothetical protein
MADQKTNTANLDLKPNNIKVLDQEAAKAKILDAALAHVQAVGGQRSHFGLHFGLVWEE